MTTDTASMESTRGWSALGILVLAAILTCTHQAAPLSYSHWCAALEMRRVSCVVKTGAPLSESTGHSDGTSLLRRVYRWKKQFVLRCCPGFMGPNCQQACFSCKGFATMTQRLNNVERLVQQACRQTNGQIPETPTTRPTRSRALRPTVTVPAINDDVRTRRRERDMSRERILMPQRESPAYSHFRSSESTATVRRRIRVKIPPEMVVELDTAKSGQHADSNALQMDQKSNAPEKPFDQSGDGKSGQWVEGKTWEESQSQEDGGPSVTYTPTSTSDVDNVWQHWDDEFQVRLSTVERHVLELTSKLRDLGPALDSMTSLNRQLDQLNTRLTTIEECHGMPPKRESAQLEEEDNLSSATETEKEPGYKGRRVHRTKVKKRNRKRKGRVTRQKSDKQTDDDSSDFSFENHPKNVLSNRRKKKVKARKPMSSAKVNDSVTSRFSETSSERQPGAASSKLRSPCPNVCHGKEMPSPPTPPPLPDRQTVRKVFTNDSTLVDALGQGHRKFYQQLKAALEKKQSANNQSPAERETSSAQSQTFSSSDESNDQRMSDTHSLVVNETGMGTLASEDPGKPGETTGDSGQNSDRRANFQLLGNSEADNGRMDLGDLVDNNNSNNNNNNNNNIGHAIPHRSNGFLFTASAVVNVMSIQITFFLTR